MKSDDYNIIYELNCFKPMKTYVDFVNVINDIKGLFSSNKICSNVFNKMLSKPDNYITNLINSINNNNEKNIMDIIECNICNGDISVYCDSNIIEDNELINAYYIFSHIGKNIKIHTINEFDYTACILRYVNNIYDNENEDIIFKSILSNAMDTIKPSFESTDSNNYIFITNDIINVNMNNESNILYFLDNKKIENDTSYKESILNILTPKKILKIFKKHCLMLLSCGGCRFFNIFEEDNDLYLYSKNNNWLVKEKQEIEVCPISLLTELQIFEFKNKQEEEYRKKYNDILQQKRNINFKNTFKHLSIDENILFNVQMKTFLIGDILEPYSDKHRTKHKSYNTLYPYISATTCNNGVADYVNYYMIDNNDGVLTICLRKNAPGFTTFHKGKFSISSSIVVFSVKKNVKLNPYNIAFSITREFENRRLKNGITIDKLLKSKVKIII